MVGKFNVENQTAGVPYAAIADACSQICTIIMSSKKSHPDRFSKIRHEPKEKLGGTTELSVLSEAVPELVDIVSTTTSRTDVSLDVPTVISITSSSSSRQPQNYSMGNEQSKARFLYAFRIFFKTACQAIQPLVMMLDDLQWSDAASLDLIETLINDVDNSNLFLICLYRSDQVPETHMFAKLIRDVEEQKESLGPLNVSHVTADNLTVQVVNELLQDVLNCDNEDPDVTYPLAELCHRRTRGNAFFVLTFLRKLRDDKLLTFNLGSHRWSWNVDQILEQTNAMTNVVDLMKQELAQLPSGLQRRMSVVACFGNSFHPEVVDHVLEQLEKNESVTKVFGNEKKENPDDQEKNWVSVVEDLGFIEKEQQTKSGCQKTSYQWIHD